MSYKLSQIDQKNLSKLPCSGPDTQVIVAGLQDGPRCPLEALLLTIGVHLLDGTVAAPELRRGIGFEIGMNGPQGGLGSRV